MRRWLLTSFLGVIGCLVFSLGIMYGKSAEENSTSTSQPLKVDTKGVTAVIKYEAPLAGFLKEINGKYKLRVTEITIAPRGYVGAHNHLGPGIRKVTSG